MPDAGGESVPGLTGCGVSAPMLALGQRAKAAAAVLAQAPSSVRDEALRSAADLLEAATERVLAANHNDVANAEAAGTSPTLVDRLRLDSDRVDAMAAGLRNVAALADPVGQRVGGWVRPNGLIVEQVRVPLGVVAIIYESRPNVTSDAFGLCLKSANAAFLRGSSAALQSNIAIADALRSGVVAAGLPADALLLVTDTSYSAAKEFMRLRSCIDCLIPRGGPALISSVLANATVPYVIDGDGNCHVYVDAAADLDMAADIVANAKLSRPSVCNAAESLLVHRAVAETFLPRIVEDLCDVELVGDAASRAISPQIGHASDEDFSAEFLSLKMSVAIVDDLEAAIAHISRHGTGHSEAIVTGDLAAAQEFTHRVDAAAVLVNASTRFVDGEEFGFGAEIGISTQKLHARGPMGLAQLTTTKFVVTGSGQTRH